MLMAERQEKILRIMQFVGEFTCLYTSAFFYV